MQEQKMDKQEQFDVLIVGGGPCGSFLGYILGKYFDYSVKIIESYPDLRDTKNQYLDRSSSITLGFRGLQALRDWGLESELDKLIVPTYGNSMHIGDQIKENFYFPYEQKDKNGGQPYMASINRRDLTCMLIESAEKTKNVYFEFSSKVINVDLEKKEILTQNRNKKNDQKIQKFQVLFGADGCNSVVRKVQDEQIRKDKQLPQDFELTKLEQCEYNSKSIIIPSKKEFEQILHNKTYSESFYEQIPENFRQNIKNFGEYQMNPKFQQSTPNINLMTLIFPDLENQFNLYFCLPKLKNSVKNMAEEEENQTGLKSKLDFSIENNKSFEQMQTDQEIHNFFLKHMPSIYARTPDIVKRFKKSPQYSSMLVLCKHWSYEGTSLLLGDAAHGMTPYGAIGTAIALKNVAYFCDLLKKHESVDNIRILSSSQKDLQKQKNLVQQKKNLFEIFQRNLKEDTEQAQYQTTDKLAFPGFSMAMHPEAMLYGQIFKHLWASLPDLVMCPFIMSQFSYIPYIEIQKRNNIYKQYIYSKMEGKKCIKEIDFSNSKQELTQLLTQNNLSCSIKIDI